MRRIMKVKPMAGGSALNEWDQMVEMKCSCGRHLSVIRWRSPAEEARTGGTALYRWYVGCAECCDPTHIMREIGCN